jgi:hypothetical protein
MKGTIKGQPFVDTPRDEQVIAITLKEYHALIAKAARTSVTAAIDARIALIVSGAALAVALIGVANIWH